MRPLRFSSLILTLALLVGCGPALQTTRLEAPSKLPEIHGVVAVQVVSNTRRLSHFLEAWTSLHAVDLEDTSKRYQLTSRATGLIGSRVFVGALPPGRYAFFNLHAFASTPYGEVWADAPVPELVGTFRVDRDRLTNLGTLVYQPLGWTQATKGARGIAYVVTRMEDEQNLDEFVAEAYPDFHAKLAADFSLGWAEDPHEEDRTRLAQRIREVGYGDHAIRLADRRFVMAGKLGRIYWREADGAWRSSDSGYSNEIGAVTQVAGGYALGGERGMTLVSTTLDGPWHAVKGPSTQEAILWMHGLADRTLVVLTRSSQGARLYRVSENFADWRQVGAITIRTNSLSPARTSHAVVLASGRIAVFGGGVRIEYDPSSNAVTEQPSRLLHEVQQQRDGTLVATGGNTGVGPGGWWHSTDEGRTWSRVHYDRAAESRLRGLFSLPFILADKREMMLSRKMLFNKLTKGFRPATEYLLRIGEPGPKGRVTSWGRAMDQSCLELLPQVSSGAELFALCVDGRVLRSGNQGRTWQVDRQVHLDPKDIPEGMIGNETVPDIET